MKRRERHARRIRGLVWRERFRNWGPFLLLVVPILTLLTMFWIETQDAVATETGTVVGTRRAESDTRPGRTLWSVELPGARFKSVLPLTGASYEYGKMVCIELRQGAYTGVVRGRMLHEGPCEGP